VKLKGVGVILIAAGTAAAAEPNAAMTIRVVNSARMPGPVLTEGEKYAAQVLVRSGVHVIWQDCSAPAACPHEPAANEVWLHVANWKPAAGSERELGFTTLDPESLSGIGVTGVYYPMVRETAAVLQVEETLVLAAALAHEIGHVLGAGHSPTGIMSPQLNRKSIVAMGLGGLFFASNQVAGIRAEAVRRTAASKASARP
jgi:hypothetical protein